MNTDLIGPFSLQDDLGQINLGLSYLPTSEKLYLTVEDITGLKVMDRNTKSTGKHELFKEIM